MYLIKDLDAITENDLDDVETVLCERLDFLCDREPESYGMIRDNWEEKVDELEDIIALFDDDERNLNEIKERIQDYQLIYGGLSRIKIR